ncbi:MAG TPA: allantoinase AllB, partial [Candidatus Xenobia bacterium]
MIVLRSSRVVLPSGERAATVHVDGGKIQAVAGFGEVPEGAACFDYGSAAIMPGVVDAHVHINEPGRTDWEGFDTITRAAAAGGTTTLVDMPLNSIPPTTTMAGLEAKRAAARGRVWVDVAFWGGAVPGNLADLAPMVEAGVRGFKCFLCPSGVDEFGHLTAGEIPAFMRELKRLGSTLLVHAELPGPLEAAAEAVAAADPTRYRTFLASRPRAAENEAIALVASLSEAIGCPTHVVHLSSSDALETVSRAAARAPFSAETCPHYLVLAAEEIPDKATPFKCCPPIRERSNRDALWDAVRDGTLCQVVSDHSPSPPGLKALEQGDFMTAWGGISSAQLSLSNTWTEARKRGATLSDITRWMCERPARLAGLPHKGRIAVGQDADFVVLDPDASFEVAPANLYHRHPLSPYIGRVLHGLVKATWLRGQQIFPDLPARPVGQLL